MFATTFKKIALAAAIVAVTATSSMAAQWAWMEQDAKVRKSPGAIAVVNYVEEGQKVKIIDKNGSWVKLALPGKDGWVKKHMVTTKPYWNNGWGNNGNWGPGYGGNVGGSFCVNGQHAQFCLGAYN